MNGLTGKVCLVAALLVLVSSTMCFARSAEGGAVLRNGMIHNRNVETFMRYYVFCVEGYEYVAFRKDDTGLFVNVEQRLIMENGQAVPVACSVGNATGNN